MQYKISKIKLLGNSRMSRLFFHFIFDKMSQYFITRLSFLIVNNYLYSLTLQPILTKQLSRNIMKNIDNFIS